VKRNFIFGIGLFVSGLGLSLNTQAAAIAIDAVTITPTIENTFNAIIEYSTPSGGFALDANQDPVVSYDYTDPNKIQIQIDLLFVPPRQAEQAVVDVAGIQPLASNDYTANLGTLTAGTIYDITASAIFPASANSPNSANSLNTTYIPPVPIPAAIWLLLSGIVPLFMVGRRKSRG